MSAIKKDRALQDAYDHRLFLRFLSYAGDHWICATGALLFVLLQIAFDLSLPYILREAIDGPISSGNEQGLYLYVGLFTGALVGHALARFLQTYLTNKTGQNMMHDLRSEIYSHLQETDVGYFDRTPVGRLVTRVSNDVESLQDLFTSGLIRSFADVLLIAGISIILLLMNWKLALITFSVVPLLVVISIWFRSHARELYRKTRKKLAKINSFLQETLNGINIIKIFRQEKSQNREFRDRNRDYRDEMIKTVFYYGIFYPAVHFVSYLATGLLIWYGGYSILEGTLTFGTFMAFWYYSKKYFRPLRNLSRRYNVFQSAMASSERIFRLLDRDPAISDPEQPEVEQPDFRDRITFRNISFAYEPDEPVIRNVSFKVHYGDQVALVGPTGAGKTTLINLLLRLYEPDEGQIQIDGTDIQNISKGGLRSLFGVIRQDVELFPRTVRENITLGKRVPEEEIHRALQYARATEFVEALPDQLDTVLGEEGETISRGQKQLLAFARIFVYDPRVLILDEATGSIDPETESRIQEGMNNLLQDRTGIIIAHRLSTIQDADRIFVIQDGRITERGALEELLAQKGVFADLYRSEMAS